ncbi:chlorophyllase [Tessaracoccus rhinocerotis]|uniref:Chlorophyllase n=2 Tax=Tessaracoccus rhinocerotis TaxID=1689449 RepID=A0A553JX03_9ACTN|nr:chlorophyllase [Tessaracoccus rhinocerotis]
MPQTISVKPVRLPAPERGTDLEVRVTAPATGSGLPVILMAHGFGGSMTSYDPLVDHWAAAGFVVVQPTFLDSATLAITPDDPRHGEIWRFRVRDVTQVIDSLDRLLAAIPGLPERVDVRNLAVVGHSWGGQTVGMLLGARVIADDRTVGASHTDPRVRAGVLLATTGTGGEDLAPFAREHFPFMSPDFGQLTTPTLVVAGESDDSPLSTRGPDWFTDAHRLSPGSRALVTVLGGEHYLGGIHGYNRTDTTDESPQRVEAVRLTSTAFLRTTLGQDADAWAAAVAAPPVGSRIDEA